MTPEEKAEMIRMDKIVNRKVRMVDGNGEEFYVGAGILKDLRIEYKAPENKGMPVPQYADDEVKEMATHEQTMAQLNAEKERLKNTIAAAKGQPTPVSSRQLPEPDFAIEIDERNREISGHRREEVSTDVVDTLSIYVDKRDRSVGR